MGASHHVSDLQVPNIAVVWMKAGGSNINSSNNNLKKTYYEILDINE